MLLRARVVFDSMPQRDVVSWNTMVIGYAQNGNLHEALWFYRELRGSRIKYNEFSFAGILTACVKSRELHLNRKAHGQVLVAGFLSNVVLSCSIIDAYAKCGQMKSARRCSDEMPVKDIHIWTTLISGYAKLGDMEATDKLFCEMPEKNPVSWTALIAGYVRQGSGDHALDLFSKMIALSVKPEQFNFSSCLCASASIASLRHMKQIHGYMFRPNLSPNAIVISSLIDMYSKSGSLEASERVFDLSGDKLGHKALRMLDDIIKIRVHPNRTTLVVILSACSHSGLVEVGVRLFESMTVEHGIVPDQEHYACLIDLLGRAGCFKELMSKIEKMPFKPDEHIWNAILGVSRIHGNVELGKKAAEELMKLDPESSAPYILLSSIYADHDKWESVEKLRGIMKKRRVNKEKALSWLEIKKKVETFAVSDGSHPRKEEIYSVLHNLTALMEEEASRT